MRESERITKIVNTISMPAIMEMAHRVNPKYPSSVIGWLVLLVGLPLCWVIGKWLKTSRYRCAEAFQGVK
jgi:putative effector of murein hydrolase LrgA (UPF0299 family)